MYLFYTVFWKNQAFWSIIHILLTILLKNIGGRVLKMTGFVTSYIFGDVNRDKTVTWEGEKE